MTPPKGYRCDAALVGFPDAGKSTLFNALTGREDSRRMPRFDYVRRPYWTINFELTGFAG